MKWVRRIFGGPLGLILLAIAGLFLAGLRPGHGMNSATVEIERPTGEEGSHQVITWDSIGKSYKAHDFANTFAGCQVLTGHWEDANLMFAGDIGAGDPMLQIRTVYADIMASSFTIASYSSFNGGVCRLMVTTKAIKTN